MASPRKIESPNSIFTAAPDSTDSEAMSPRPRPEAFLTVAVRRLSRSLRTMMITGCSVGTRCSRRCSMRNLSAANGKTRTGGSGVRVLVELGKKIAKINRAHQLGLQHKADSLAKAGSVRFHYGSLIGIYNPDVRHASLQVIG